MLHEEADGIPTSTTPKAFINFLGRGNRKGGCFFVMKRAKPQVICPSFFQFYKPANDLCDIDAAQNLLYGLW